MIILDTPPALAVTDPAVLSRLVSASLVVVRQGRTRSAELRSSVQRLAVAGRPIAGVILNRISDDGRSYYYPEYQDGRPVGTEEKPAAGAPASGGAAATHDPAKLPARRPT